MFGVFIAGQLDVDFHLFQRTSANAHVADRLAAGQVPAVNRELAIGARLADWREDEVDIRSLVIGYALEIFGPASVCEIVDTNCVVAVCGDV